MKYFKSIFSILFLIFVIAACESDDDNPDPNSLGGDPNVPLGQVGNVISTGSVKIGDSYHDINSSIEITQNNNGIATVNVKADLSDIPELAAFNNFIPSSMKDSEGRISTDLQFKITSEGVQDNMNRDKKLHTLVKYECKPGDQYKLPKSDGNTITRTVMSKSDQDDFPYGFYNIKTILVEQDSRIPGIKKIQFRLNHKFGLVFVEIFAEDGSSANMYLYSQY